MDMLESIHTLIEAQLRYASAYAMSPSDVSNVQVLHHAGHAIANRGDRSTESTRKERLYFWCTA